MPDLYVQVQLAGMILKLLMVIFTALLKMHAWPVDCCRMIVNGWPVLMMQRT